MRGLVEGAGGAEMWAFTVAQPKIGGVNGRLSVEERAAAAERSAMRRQTLFDVVGKKQCRTLTFWPLPTLPSDTVRSHFAQFGELVDVVSVWRRTGGGWRAGGASLRRVACALGRKKACFPPTPNPHPFHPHAHLSSPFTHHSDNHARPPDPPTPRLRLRHVRHPGGSGGGVPGAAPDRRQPGERERKKRERASGAGGRGKKKRAATTPTPQPDLTSPPVVSSSSSFQIFAKRSVPHEACPRSKKVFVGGLAPETTNGAWWEGKKKKKKKKEGVPTPSLRCPPRALTLTPSLSLGTLLPHPR